MAKKFIGVPYPITKKPRGLLQSSSGVDQIKADLLQLLLTNPGERVMLLDYGTPLKDLMFEPNDETVQIMAREMIIRAIELWEPRIAVNQIDVGVGPEFKDSLNPAQTSDDELHILFIRISFFDPEEIQEVQELVLQVPLGG